MRRVRGSLPSADRAALTRRELLRFGVASGVAALWTPNVWAQEQAPPTPGTLVGPFYPEARPREQDTDLTRIKGRRVRAQGQVVHVAGRVLDVRGEVIRGARVELWQANTFGRYNHPSDTNPAPLDPGFQGYGVQLTDQEGRFRFTTIKPGPYRNGPSTRAPHLHFQVTGRIDRRVTQMFFPGEPLNEQDFVFQSVPRDRDRLVATLHPAPPDEDPTSRLLRWDIVLRQG